MRLRVEEQRLQGDWVGAILDRVAKESNWRIRVCSRNPEYQQEAERHVEAEKHSWGSRPWLDKGSVCPDHGRSSPFGKESVVCSRSVRYSWDWRDSTGIKVLD